MRLSALGLWIIAAYLISVALRSELVTGRHIMWRPPPWNGFLDYCRNTPRDPLRTADCVGQRIAMIEKNLSLMRK